MNAIVKPVLEGTPHAETRPVNQKRMERRGSGRFSPRWACMGRARLYRRGMFGLLPRPFHYVSVANLSAGGACLKTVSTATLLRGIGVGERLELDLSLPDGSRYRVMTEVRYIHPWGNLCGVKFIDPSQEMCGQLIKMDVTRKLRDLWIRAPR